jgi:hypothetical protein
MPAHITRVQVIRFESPGRDLERTSHPSSCFLMPKHSAQRFSGARSPSISAIRLVPMNCVTLQPYACPNRSCGQDIARTSSAGARLPPPRAAMRGRREAPGTAKCGARPEFSGKGTCLPGSAPCAPQELQQATRAHGELEKSGTDEHLAPPTCTAAAAFFAGCPG